MKSLYLILQEDCDGEGAGPWIKLHASPEAALAYIREHVNDGLEDELPEYLRPIPDAWGYIQSEEAIATYKREFRNARWAMAFDDFVLTLHEVEAPE